MAECLVGTSVVAGLVRQTAGGGGWLGWRTLRAPGRCWNKSVPACRRLVGPIGAGAQRMKLAINLPLGVFWQGLRRRYALCRHLNLDPAWLAELFADTSGGPPTCSRPAARRSRSPLQSKDPGSATLRLREFPIRKDFRTMVAEARTLGFSLPLAEKTLAVYDQASQEG